MHEAAVLVHELVDEPDDGFDGHLQRDDDLGLGPRELRADLEQDGTVVLFLVVRRVEVMHAERDDLVRRLWKFIG
jgi:hypothetical protein